MILAKRPRIVSFGKTIRSKALVAAFSTVTKGDRLATKSLTRSSDLQPLMTAASWREGLSNVTSKTLRSSSSRKRFVPSPAKASVFAGH